MRRLLLFTLLLFSSIVARAQDFAGQARSIVDSLLRVWEKDSTNALGIPDTDTFYFARLEDSLTRAFMLAHLDSTLAREKYSWPFWYLQNSLGRNPPQDTSIRYPSLTQQYLLETKYGVRMEGISNGCLWQRAFVIHDSLMMAAIRQKHGFDFFHRVAIEADSLDRVGAGLRLPYIKGGQPTETVLGNAFSDLWTVRKAQLHGDAKLYLVVDFKGDSITGAYWVEPSIWGSQFGTTRFNPKERLIERLREMNWKGPRFQNQPANKLVVFDFDSKEFRFY